MDKKYYAIHFQFKGVPQCIIIDKETLEKDANGVEDYWGEFMLYDKAYQFQIHYTPEKIRVNVNERDDDNVMVMCDAIITRYVIGQQIYKGRNTSEKPTILF